MMLRPFTVPFCFDPSFLLPIFPQPLTFFPVTTFFQALKEMNKSLKHFYKQIWYLSYKLIY